MDFIYNGVRLNDVVEELFNSRVARVGRRYLHTAHRARFSGRLPANDLRAARDKLLTPRRPLLLVDGNAVVSRADGPDTDNGPNPLSVDVDRPPGSPDAAVTWEGEWASREPRTRKAR